MMASWPHQQTHSPSQETILATSPPGPRGSGRQPVGRFTQPAAFAADGEQTEFGEPAACFTAPLAFPFTLHTRK